MSDEVLPVMRENIHQSLCMEGGPTEEERNDNHSYSKSWVMVENKDRGSDYQAFSKLISCASVC